MNHIKLHRIDDDNFHQPDNVEINTYNQSYEANDDSSTQRGSVDMQEGESKLKGYACVASGMLS